MKKRKIVITCILLAILCVAILVTYKKRGIRTPQNRINQQTDAASSTSKTSSIKTVSGNTTKGQVATIKPNHVLHRMYRLYNPNSGEHFYTENGTESDHLETIGWRYEGIGWYNEGSTGKPVYRLYNPNSGDHHYTVSPKERKYLVKSGWKDEGIGWYSGGSIPIYRQYNPNAKTGSHNFTKSKAENDALVRSGWKAEGIAWYSVHDW